jgi:hypothetical protein
MYPILRLNDLRCFLKPFVLKLPYSKSSASTRCGLNRNNILTSESLNSRKNIMIEIGLGSAASMPSQTSTNFNNPNQDIPPRAFSLFPSLPCEIRLRIWELSSGPRRIIYRPWKRTWEPPDLELSHPLLLVNFEAHQVFRRRYNAAFLFGGTSSWISYSLDTLCLDCGLDDIHRLLLQHPDEMSKIETIEIPPDALVRTGFAWESTQLTKMTNLKRVIVRWGSNADYKESLERNRAWVCDFSKLLRVLWDALDTANEVWKGTPPVLSAMFSPDEAPSTWLRGVISLERGIGSLSPPFTLREPSQETWDTFEVGMCKEKNMIWPGRRTSPTKKETVTSGADWFAYEIVQHTRAQVEEFRRLAKLEIEARRSQLLLDERT